MRESFRGREEKVQWQNQIAKNVPGTENVGGEKIAGLDPVLC